MFEAASALGRAAVFTLGGAFVGGVVHLLTGGDPADWTGVAIGAAVGFGASFIGPLGLSTLRCVSSGSGARD